MRIGFGWPALFVLAFGFTRVLAQVPDSLAAPPADSVVAPVSDSAAATVIPPSLAPATVDSAAPPHLDLISLRGNSGNWLRLFTRDTLSRLEYHDLGEATAQLAGIYQYSLGTYGLPSWIGSGGSLPLHWSVDKDGTSLNSLITLTPEMSSLPMEDADTIIVHPMHQSFYDGGTGKLLAVSLREPDWDAPHPTTRLRHLIGPYELLYTDASFMLNPGERNNLRIALTRQTIGSTSADNVARFENNVNEHWIIRARYRHRFSNRFALTVQDVFYDEIALQNGGRRGWLDSLNAGFRSIPPQSSPGFADSAFNPLFLFSVNPTMRINTRSNLVEGKTRFDWTGDNNVITEAGASHYVYARRYSDGGYNVLTRSRTQDEVDTRYGYDIYSAWIEHATSIKWAALDIGGRIARVTTYDDSLFRISENGYLSSLRGKLSFTLAPFRALALARLDNTFGQTTYGISGTLEATPFDKFALWVGAGVTTRPYSLLERQITSAHIAVQGGREPEPERSVIVEGGARIALSWLETDARVYLRNTSIKQVIYSGYYVDTLFSRHSLIIDNREGEATYVGASLYARMHLWLLNLELRGAWTGIPTSSGAAMLRTEPEYSGSASVFYRGSLIENALELKVGGSVSYASSYYPMLYNPETDWFGLPDPSLTGANASDTYTSFRRVDAFLFATVKRRATIQLTVFNIFDENYITTQFYPMVDRSIRVGVEWVLFD